MYIKHLGRQSLMAMPVQATLCYATVVSYYLPMKKTSNFVYKASYTMIVFVFGSV